MINTINSALSGLQTASRQVEQSAQNIAEGPSSTSNLIEDVVDIRVAETAFKANVQTIKIAQELSEELLNIFDKRV